MKTNSSKKWTPQEDAELAKLYESGLTYRKISALIGRSTLSIEYRAALVRAKLNLTKGKTAFIKVQISKESTVMPKPIKPYTKGFKPVPTPNLPDFNNEFLLDTPHKGTPKEATQEQIDVACAQIRELIRIKNLPKL